MESEHTQCEIEQKTIQKEKIQVETGRLAMIAFTRAEAKKRAEDEPNRVKKQLEDEAKRVQRAIELEKVRVDSLADYAKSRRGTRKTKVIVQIDQHAKK
jgi:hypothetical protein